MKLEDLKLIGSNVYELPRGGYLVDTPSGYLQFGSPPETIKDTMSLPDGVPEIFVLPEKMFNWMKGISIAEIEFPLYYNFFIRSRKTTIICRDYQFSKIKRVLEESLFGPENFDLSIDFSETDEERIPDIKSEMEYFRNGNKLSNMVQFGIFKNNNFTYKGLSISITEKGNYRVYHSDAFIGDVPGAIEYKTTYTIGERLREPYTPPLFGVTCLGPSHGFDPGENTSGFIIWLNHQGIMVDPPVNSTEWLEASNVSPKFIDSIILTHCHADHDAGTFQKILEEGKVNVYTTETVMKSFLRKYASLSDVEPEYLSRLFEFHPVKIGTPIYINGGKFGLFYALHSIPTIGFRMEFQDQSFVYTSDHNNSPELHKELYEKGVIKKCRYEALTGFPWDSKVIYHESGVPPLHTPIKYLNSLPEEIQKRIVIYHIAKKDFPEETSLTLAKFGMENTLYFETEPPPYEEAYQILSVFGRIDFMRDMPIWKAQEFLDIVEIKRYFKGDKIIEKGSTGDEFHIIYSGNISVDSGGLDNNKIYGPYDYFGEVALITNQKRAAHVYAATDVMLFTIEKNKFLNFIIGTEFEKILKKVAEIRSSETWNLLSMNPLLRDCTSTQKTWLESIFNRCNIVDPGIFMMEGKPFKSIYLIRDGEVDVRRCNILTGKLGKGDFIGEPDRLYMNLNTQYTYINTTPLSLYEIKGEDLKYFLDKNPGLIMKFRYDFMVKQ